ncbi:unnamed protein product [Rotaria magnacalcarata]|uniref:Uncharacterized protein n=2 Tax=Rotaria magnacalcarata TaxID=392030 RepID=A0A816S8W2_9BILA|nr:unnamed protein product [Rotaria magnacalcarata]
MMDSPIQPPVKSISLTADPQIQKTRKILLIVLGVLVVLSAIITIAEICNTTIGEDSVHRPPRGVSIVQALVLHLFYSFGFFFTYRCHKLSLQVFAGLNVVLLFNFGIGFVGLLVSTIILAFSNSDERNIYIYENRNINVPVAICVSILTITAALVFTIWIVMLSFKLAKLIGMEQPETVT